ncbi:MAG: FtsQ-type POTRA domain-containing protein [Piscirickettsiaceae bacterium]|nr:FtsQ-type POTRA domain-containing protein [Piscirickettsiaceae bacterium]
MIASRTKRGATRKPVRKQQQPLAWQQLLRHGFVSLVFLALIATGVFLQQDDTLPILHVSVEGDFDYVDKTLLMNAVRPFTRGSFMAVDVAGIQTAGEALPWVKEVQVRRIWPDSLHLIVVEQVAIARWGHKSFVNAQGELFTPFDRVQLDHLALLEGPDKSFKMVTQRYLQMTKILQDEGLEIKSLMMNKRRAWNMTLKNGMKVVFGRANNEQRFKRFVRIYKRGLSQYQSQIVAMDMRYPNGLSVVWKQGQKPDFNGTV